MDVIEKKVNSNKNRNTRFVKVNETRVCKCCGKPILKGVECLTLNKKGIGRQWQCMECTKNELSSGKIGIDYTDQKQEDICLLENAWFFIQLFQKCIIISCWWNLTKVRILSQNPWKLCKENGHKRDNTGARKYLRM